MKQDYLNEALLEQMAQAIKRSQRVGVCIIVSAELVTSNAPYEIMQWLAENAELLWFKKAQKKASKQVVPELSELLSMLDEEQKQNDDDHRVVLNEEEICITRDDVELFIAKYKQIVDGFIDLYSNEGESKETYYQKLWLSLSSLFDNKPSVKNGVILYLFLLNRKTPFFEVPIGLRMPNSEYRETLELITPQLSKMCFIFSLSNSQKTELASQILHTMNELKSPKAKAVFLSQVISYAQENKRH